MREPDRAAGTSAVHDGLIQQEYNLKTRLIKWVIKLDFFKYTRQALEIPHLMLFFSFFILQNTLFFFKLNASLSSTLQQPCEW